MCSKKRKEQVNEQLVLVTKNNIESIFRPCALANLIKYKTGV